jgi:uncharacterized repeat protein (TIGR02543 family)
MLGGKIYNNTATNGGGVNNSGLTAVFNMYGGEIYGNTATGSGGGLYNLSGKFGFSSGEICGNTAGINGGGVANLLSEMNMSGGKICGNSAANSGGGVYMPYSSLANLYIGAGALFTDNRAAKAYERATADDSLYETHILLGEGAGKWTDPLIQGYNNYDISYSGGLQLETYSVTYLANGADSGLAPVDKNSYLTGATVTVLDNSGGLIKSGYTFAGWNTAPTGQGADFAATGSSTLIMGESDITLYAKWKELAVTTYRVSVNNSYAGENNGTGDYAPGETVIIRAGSLSSHSFDGWTANDSVFFEDAHSAQTTFIMPACDVTVIANWRWQEGGDNGTKPPKPEEIEEPEEKDKPAETEDPAETEEPDQPQQPLDPEEPYQPGGVDPEVQPNPHLPGHTLSPEGDGYLESNEEGVPLGEWLWDEQEQVWAFYPYAPLSEVPQTGDQGLAPRLFCLLGLSLLGLYFTLRWGTKNAGRGKSSGRTIGL